MVFSKHSNFLLLRVANIIWEPLRVEVYFIKNLQILPFSKMSYKETEKASWNIGTLFIFLNHDFKGYIEAQTKPKARFER
jgi:hypothetical protein